MYDLLARRGAETPDAVAYTFLDADVPQVRTWSEMHARAGGVARRLRDAGLAPTDRALLVLPEGLEYLDALYGCMRAGILAVPAPPPDPRRLDRTLPRVLALARDSTPSAVVTPPAIGALLTGPLADLPQIEPGGTAPFEDTPSEIAYLQYTSGSTADPKGVMVSHANLRHQLADFDTGYAHEGGTIVSWIPATHDLGLVYGRFMGVYKGIHTVFFSPADFMARPRRWLEALSRYGGTHSPSPNFGFEYAARRVRDLTGLDLGHVRLLLNGAEPIRSRSERAFVERFAPTGLRPEALTHAMGMSEATAKIVTEPRERLRRFVTVDPTALADNRVVLAPEGIEVASNGATVMDTTVRIVHPRTRVDQGSDRVGELWVGGTTVAAGYWNRPAQTEATFRAHTADGEGPFLRTGDLGFLHGGELYLVGRAKDVLIVRGQNHHPQDLEWAIDGVHPALRPNCAAAFGFDRDGTEAIGLVAEVRPEAVDDPEAVFGAIRGALSDLGLAPARLGLLPPRTLPKTSSGKIQRRKTAADFASGALQRLYEWEAPLEPAPPPGEARSVRELLVEQAAALLGLDPEDVHTDLPFRELGLDSVRAVELVERLAVRIGRPIPATVLWDHPTIDALAIALEPSPDAPVARAVAEMSEAEAEAALLAELEDL